MRSRRIAQVVPADRVLSRRQYVAVERIEGNRMAAERKPISKRIRFEIFKRDRFTCQYCGRMPPAVTLQVDHVVAVANGGTNSQLNLLTSCADCNSGKSDRPISDVVPAISEVIADRKERTKQLAELNQLLFKERAFEDAAIYRLGQLWCSHLDESRGHKGFSPAAALTVRGLLRKLPEAEIHEAILIAFARVPGGDLRTFKYFCGVCRSKIKEASGNGR